MQFLKRKNILFKIAAVCALSAMLAAQTARAEAEGGNPGSGIPKEENIYVSLAGDGSFKNAYVVNEFTLKEPGLIVDYGRYDSVRSLTAAESISVGVGEVRIKAPAGRFYYQGNLGRLVLPWRFSVSYLLDGKEAKAADLSGVEGSLQINIKITKNPGASGEFERYYAVQTVVTLDAEICADIEAEGATIASAGRNKMVTFTTLPGSEAEYTVKAQVKDFHMDGIQFSAVPLSMGIDIPDADLLDDKISQFVNGMEVLDEGAQSLDNGAGELKNGAARLKKGIENMKAGIAGMLEGLQTLDAKGPELIEGSSAIMKGLSEMQNSLGQFSDAADGLSGLIRGSGEIKTGIGGLSEGLSRLSGSFDEYRKQLSQGGIDANTILQSNTRMITELTAQINALEAKLAAVPGESAEADALRSQMASLEQMAGLLQANSGIISADQQFIGQLEKGIGSVEQGSSMLNGQYETFDQEIRKIPSMLEQLPGNMARLREAVDAINAGYGKLHAGLVAYVGGVNELGKGCVKLRDGYSSIVKGYNDVYAGISELSEGARNLAEGTGELRKGTALMAGNINNAYGELLNSIGGEFEPVSYISAKNTNVRSVQFIMQTENIEKKQPPAEKSEFKERLTFWERLLDLFGLLK